MIFNRQTRQQEIVINTTNFHFVEAGRKAHYSNLQIEEHI